MHIQNVEMYPIVRNTYTDWIYKKETSEVIVLRIEVLLLNKLLLLELKVVLWNFFFSVYQVKEKKGFINRKETNFVALNLYMLLLWERLVVCFSKISL